MPVVINKQTGKAEDLSPEIAEASIARGTHSIPLVTKDGTFTSVSPAEVSDAIKQGFRQPEPTELQSMLDYTEHTTPQAQIRTGLRQALNTVSLGAFDAVYPRIAKIDPEQYRKIVQKDDEANPGIAITGKVAGILSPIGPLAGGMRILGGAATKLGMEAAKAAQLAEGAFTAKALQVGAREAAQTALVQAGDEVSKQFTMEPEKSIQSSLIDMGLAGLTGAAFGVGASAGNKFVLQPLVKASKESLIGRTLSTIKSRAEGMAVVDDVDALASKAGVELTPEAKAAMSGDATLKQQIDKLAKAPTRAGSNLRESLDEFRTTLKNSIFSVLGKSEKEAGEEISRSTLGKRLQDAVSDVVGAGKKVVDDLYAPLNPILKQSELPENFTNAVQTSIDKYGDEIRLFVKESTGEKRLVNQITFEMASNVRTFEDLKVYIKKTMDDLKRQGKNDLADVFYKAVKENEAKAMQEVIERTAPNFLDQYKNATSAYKALRDKLSSLGEIVGIKKFYGTEDLLEKLTDPMKAEKILDSLTSEKRAEVFNTINSKFPELRDAIRKAHLDQIKVPLKKGVLDVDGLVKQIDNMTPEAKEFVFGAEAVDKLNALGTLFKRLGKSKDAAVLDSILSKVPGGLGSILGSMGLGGVGGAIAGYAVGTASKEAADAFKLAMLKYIASGAEASAGGFNAMFQAANAAYKGATRMEKGISSIFKPNISGVEALVAPSAKSLGMLDKVVVAAQTDPTKLNDVSGDLGEYLPDHAAYLGATSARAVSYLASLRPDTGKQSPLEPNRQPSDVEIAKYNRALALVEQPMMVLKHIKEGTLTPQDITTISTVYPALYDSMKEQMMDKLIEYQQKGIKMDYPTRLSLSLFLGMDLESSIRPQNIISNQSLYAPPMPPQAPRKGAPSSLKSSKLPNFYSTPEQLREQKRSK